MNVDELESKPRKNMIEELIDEIEKEAEGLKEFDTGVIIDDAFDSIIIKDGKVTFEGHDLKWALQTSNPFTVYNALLLVKDLVKGEKAMRNRRSDDLELFQKIYG